MVPYRVLHSYIYMVHALMISREPPSTGPRCCNTRRLEHFVK